MLVRAVYGSLWADQHTLPTDRTAALLMDLSLPTMEPFNKPIKPTHPINHHHPTNAIPLQTHERCQNTCRCAQINATWRLFPLFMVKCLQEFVWFMVCLIYDFIRYWRRHIQVCLRTIGVSFLDYHLLYPLSAQCSVLGISWTIAVCCMGRPPPWRQY